MRSVTAFRHNSQYKVLFTLWLSDTSSLIGVLPRIHYVTHMGFYCNIQQATPTRSANQSTNGTSPNQATPTTSANQSTNGTSAKPRLPALPTNEWRSRSTSSASHAYQISMNQWQSRRWPYKRGCIPSVFPVWPGVCCTGVLLHWTEEQYKQNGVF